MHTYLIREMEKYTVLVAEDDDSNFLYLQILLRKYYNVLRARNGVEAVEMVREHRPRFVFMDIKMPEMNGIEAMEVIRGFEPEIPIIMQSSYAFDSDIHAAMDKGATAYLTKPIQSSTLFNLLRELGLFTEDNQ